MTLQSILARFIGTAALLAGLASVLPVSAAPTVLTFDEFPSNTSTALTTQYQSLGITAVGATVTSAFNLGLPYQTFENLLYAPYGNMQFIIDSLITGEIQAVSAYYSAGPGLEFYAYDASNMFLGGYTTPIGIYNGFLSFTSPGNPISRVEFLGPGAGYGIDTLTFTPFSSVPEPSTAVLFGIGLMGLIVASRHKASALKRMNSI